MKRQATALIVSGGGFQGLSLVKALRALPGVRVLVADCYDENVSRYFADAFFVAPMLGETQAFSAFILELCAREEVSDVFASTSLELAALDALRARLDESGVTLHVSSPAVLALGADKLLFYRWLVGQGLAALPFYADSAEASAGQALLGKPRGTWGGRGQVRLQAGQDIGTVGLKDGSAYVWQSYLPEFDEYSVDFAIDAQGKVSPLGLRRRVRTLGGFAILCEPGAPDFVAQQAQRCVAALAAAGARGPLNLQLLSVGNEAWVSDFNPRAGTSMPLSLVLGFNPLAFLLGQAGAAPEVAESPRPTLRTLRILDERAIAALDLRAVRGVVFDLDDTLFDQKRWMLGKLELTWASLQAQLPSRTEFLAMALRIIEEGNRAHLFDALCRELGLPDTVCKSLIDCYRLAVPTLDALYGDSRVCLDQLRRHGYRLGLITDNPAASQRQKLLACGLGDCFDALMLTGEHGISKPDARAFDGCAQDLALDPDQLVMVGDNLYRDIDGAVQAGYRHAFHIQRDGGFFNFNRSSWAQLVTPADRWSTLNGLHELHWYLKSKNTPIDAFEPKTSKP
ncbi:MAG: HAD-IA family hydrolase [Burkholderiaceae bacterium]|nr:HAD-IA family hydrolase [Burkholderiaceae bacterium]